MHVHKDSVNECENGAHHYSYSCTVSVIKDMAESDNLCKSFQILFVIVLLLIVFCSVLSLLHCQLTLVHKYALYLSCRISSMTVPWGYFCVLFFAISSFEKYTAGGRVSVSLLRE